MKLADGSERGHPQRSQGSSIRPQLHHRPKEGRLPALRPSTSSWASPKTDETTIRPLMLFPGRLVTEVQGAGARMVSVPLRWSAGRDRAAGGSSDIPGNTTVLVEAEADAKVNAAADPGSRVRVLPNRTYEAPASLAIQLASRRGQRLKPGLPRTRGARKWAQLPVPGQSQTIRLPNRPRSAGRVS